MLNNFCVNDFQYFRKPNYETILADAKTRLVNLCETNFANIAKELQDLDPYQYSRAYSAGLQEFIEAFTYYEYLIGAKFMHWDDLQEKLTYVRNPAKNTVKTDKTDGKEENEDIKDDVELAEDINELQLVVNVTNICFVQPIEFMLGLADLSGEVMRRCINSLGSGDIDACFKACNFIQNLYSW